MQRTTFCVAALAAGLFSVSAVSAQDHSIGSELYRSYCASCHGDNGTGGGPVAPFLNIDMPNLTTIAQRNDGVFPFSEVVEVISGGPKVEAHGGAIPIWGSVFMRREMGRAGYHGSTIETMGRTLALTLYLESIQQ